MVSDDLHTLASKLEREAENYAMPYRLACEISWAVVRLREIAEEADLKTVMGTSEQPP